MRDYKSIAHTRWDCKYHVVFIPKYRQKVIYGRLRQFMGEIFHELAGHRVCKIEEGHLMPDHVHMCISIPPKHTVSKVVGYMKSKNAIAIARKFKNKTRNFKGENFWGVAISFRPLASTKKWSGNISINRTSGISISIRWICLRIDGLSRSRFAPLRGSPV